MYCATTRAEVCACIPGGHRPRYTRARAQPKQTPAHTTHSVQLGNGPIARAGEHRQKEMSNNKPGHQRMQGFCCHANPGNPRHSTPKGHHFRASVSKRHIPTHTIRQKMAAYTQALTAGRRHSPFPCWEPQNLPRGMMHNNDPCDDRTSWLQNSPAGLLLARTSPKPKCKPAYL
jgi:hypothetical protein